MWWSPSDPDRLSTYDDIEVVFLDLNVALPTDAVRLVPQPVVRQSELRKRIESTRHRYWNKGGEANVSELTDQILSFLHDAGVAVRSDDYIGGPLRLPPPGNSVPTLADRIDNVANSSATKGWAHDELREIAESLRGTQ